MKVVIPGGSGQVGTVLARAFHGDGHEVVVLSRHPDHRPWRVVAWDGSTLADWRREIDGCDVVINLAGRSVNCRYTAANRHEITASRVLSTQGGRDRRLPRPRVRRESGCKRARRRSTRTDTTRRTTSHPAFSAAMNRPRRAPGDSALPWQRHGNERSTRRATDRTRKVALRSAMTLSPIAAGFSTRCWASRGAALAAAPEMAGNSCRGFTTRIS